MALRQNVRMAVVPERSRCLLEEAGPPQYESWPAPSNLSSAPYEPSGSRARFWRATLARPTRDSGRRFRCVRHAPARVGTTDVELDRAGRKNPAARLGLP